MIVLGDSFLILEVPETFLAGYVIPPRPTSSVRAPFGDWIGVSLTLSTTSGTVTGAPEKNRTAGTAIV
jgi:hypothetical protein